MEKITVKNLFKVFGEQPEEAMSLLRDGKSKQEIYELTGMTVGVQDANFSVMAGETFVIMGLSGSGKSTMVRMINRLVEPTAGELLVDGEDVLQMSGDELVRFRRGRTCMVFQSFALMPHLSVLDNAAFGLELSGVDKGQRHERARQALEQVGLKGWENAWPKELSGGMQQRVGLARGLTVDPDIMLMDEAFSALDPLIRTEMQDELIKLQENQQRTIVFISHDLNEALRIGDRIAIMEGGRVVQVGTPEEILQNPVDDYVRAFFRGVDPTGVLSAGDVALQSQPTVIWRREKGDVRAVLEQLNQYDRDFAYVLGRNRSFHGVVSADSLRSLLDRGGDHIREAFLPDVSVVHSDESLQNILPAVAHQPWPIPVVDENGVYRGVISKNRFLRTLHWAEQGTLSEGFAENLQPEPITLKDSL